MGNPEKKSFSQSNAEDIDKSFLYHHPGLGTLWVGVTRCFGQSRNNTKKAARPIFNLRVLKSSKNHHFRIRLVFSEPETFSESRCVGRKAS